MPRSERSLHGVNFTVTNRPRMKRNTRTISRQPTEAEIQHTAYLLWIEEGRPEGRDFDHWMAAKEMLCRRHGRDAKTRRPVPEIAAPAAVHATN
jgi:hypothetical protein